jgi:hypothetical protein
MAAATDKFVKVGSDATITSLEAPGKSIGAGSINIGSGANWPTDTGVVFSIRKVALVGGQSTLVAGTYTVWRGTISGNVISNLILVKGTDQPYSAGQDTQVYISISTEQHNSMVDGILVGHSQTGTHKAFTESAIVPTAAIQDSAVTTAKLADATVTNAKLSTTAGELGGIWQSYTPTFTNFTLGGGTVSARYTKIGKTIHATGKVTLSGSTMGTQPIMTLPVASSSFYTLDRAVLGAGILGDTGTGEYEGLIIWRSTTTAAIWALGAAGAYVNITNIGATVPMTWANTDTFSWDITYEAA